MYSFVHNAAESQQSHQTPLSQLVSVRFCTSKTSRSAARLPRSSDCKEEPIRSVALLFPSPFFSDLLCRFANSVACQGDDQSHCTFAHPPVNAACSPHTHRRPVLSASLLGDEDLKVRNGELVAIDAARRVLFGIVSFFLPFAHSSPWPTRVHSASCFVLTSFTCVFVRQTRWQERSLPRRAVVQIYTAATSAARTRAGEEAHTRLSKLYQDTGDHLPSEGPPNCVLSAGWTFRPFSVSFMFVHIPHSRSLSPSPYLIV